MVVAVIDLDHAIAPRLADLLQPQPGLDAVAVHAVALTAELHAAGRGAGHCTALGDGSVRRPSRVATHHREQDTGNKETGQGHAPIVTQADHAHTNERRHLGAVRRLLAAIDRSIAIVATGVPIVIAVMAVAIAVVAIVVAMAAVAVISRIVISGRAFPVLLALHLLTRQRTVVVVAIGIAVRGTVTVLRGTRYVAVIHEATMAITLGDQAIVVTVVAVAVVRGVAAHHHVGDVDQHPDQVIGLCLRRCGRRDRRKTQARRKDCVPTPENYGAGISNFSTGLKPDF